MTAILTRKSELSLTEPAPDDEEFGHLLQGAATAPDHGRLRPWRWILVRGASRGVVWEAVARDVPERSEQILRGGDRAPLRAILIFKPQRAHKIPEWEQLAATVCMTHALMLLLHERGYGTIWRTGQLCTSVSARRVLGVTAEEEILGSLDIGSKGGPESAAPRRTLPDIADRVSRFVPRVTVPGGSASFSTVPFSSVTD
ncbi:nitroreductase family protein [Streptosporangium algeriense]|uniref:Putative NAD(P)H nitroreductase n=1 Tax=Streptosporangium algeriense TaxID=1682748 RepID=A0ABW3DRR3_9ACTN